MVMMVRRFPLKTGQNKTLPDGRTRLTGMISRVYPTRQERSCQNPTPAIDPSLLSLRPKLTLQSSCQKRKKETTRQMEEILLQSLEAKCSPDDPILQRIIAECTPLSDPASRAILDKPHPADTLDARLLEALAPKEHEGLELNAFDLMLAAQYREVGKKKGVFFTHRKSTFASVN